MSDLPEREMAGAQGTESRETAAAVQPEAVKKPVEDACDSFLLGYIFLWVKISIGTLQLLPSFVGYGLLKEGLKKLAPRRPSLSLLEPLANVLMGTSLVEWVFMLVSFRNPLQNLWWIAGVLDLYFHYQLLTDLAEIVGEAGTEEARKASGKLRVIRVFYLLFRFGQLTSNA